MKKFMTILLSFCTIGLFMIVNRHLKKDSWFKSLKPGDKLLVQIFAEDCECFVEATVTESAKNDYINADVSKDAELCKKLSCWSNVTQFRKISTKPIKK